MIIALRSEHGRIDKLYDISRAFILLWFFRVFRSHEGYLLFPFEWLYFPCFMCRPAVFIMYISWIPVHW
jgi:hypothetical protein